MYWTVVKTTRNLIWTENMSFYFVKKTNWKNSKVKFVSFFIESVNSITILVIIPRWDAPRTWLTLSQLFFWQCNPDNANANCSICFAVQSSVNLDRSGSTSICICRSVPVSSVLSCKKRQSGCKWTQMILDEVMMGSPAVRNCTRTMVGSVRNCKRIIMGLTC